MDDPMSIEDFIERGQQMASAKYTKRGIRLLWLAVALAAAAIILTDWRIGGLALLAVVVGGTSLIFAGFARKPNPDVTKEIADAFHRKLAEDPNWRPKVQP